MTSLLALLLALPVSAAPAPAPVALLDGKTVVTEPDLADYQATQACYGEGAQTSRKAALMRLLEAALAADAMREHGGPVAAPADVETEAGRIDRETRAPEILACIKAHFGADRARYLRVFVAPKLAESWLRVFLLRDKGVSAGARAKIAAAAKAARKGTTLEKAAQELGVSYSSATYSLESSTAAAQPAELARFGFLPPPAQADFIRAHLLALATGQLTAEPIEGDYDIRLVRLVSSDGMRFQFETLSVRKAGQEEWFKTIRKRKLEVRDAELKAWLAGIKGNPRLFAVTLIE